MSPILVRPVREQFEHDRIIRILQARYKRKYEVAINPGAEQNASVMIGELTMYPDLLLYSPERGRKVQATVEVETTESVNTLEAMAEWGPFGRLRAAFYLYVPANSIDTVRRLCTEHSVSPAEIWTYHSALDQVRFTMVHRSADAPRLAEGRPPRAAEPRAPRAAEGRPTAAAESGTSASPARAVESRPLTRNAEARSARPEGTTPRHAESRSGHPAKSGSTATAARGDKVKAAKKAAPRAAKKSASPKAPPRATAARARKVVKKPARKSAAKRSATPKR